MFLRALLLVVGVAVGYVFLLALLLQMALFLLDLKFGFLTKKDE